MNGFQYKCQVNTACVASLRFFFGIALICGAVLVNGEAERIQQYEVALGCALLTWGLAELDEAKIHGKRVDVYRRQRPIVFYLLLFGNRVVLGMVMLLAGLWYTFTRAIT